jgi:hypothetical protein
VPLHLEPIRKFVTIEQVAALAHIFLSNAAASISSAIIPIDGGWTTQSCIKKHRFVASVLLFEKPLKPYNFAQS